MALPQEYWMEHTLREIASAAGTPLVLDNATMRRLFAHYARILVDIDFSRKIFHKILVEREGGSYPMDSWMKHHLVSNQQTRWCLTLRIVL
jgi:hypothetical protein